MGAIPIHHTPTTERPWDGPAATAAAPNDAQVLTHMHAWRDPNGDPAMKASYKGPHHGPSADSPAVLPAVRAGLAVMGGARGGMNIPDADRAGVTAHYQAHLDDAAAS
jgi:hypothetical protein